MKQLGGLETWKVDTRLLSKVVTLGAKVAPGMAARWTTALTPLCTSSMPESASTTWP